MKVQVLLYLPVGSATCDSRMSSTLANISYNSIAKVLTMAVQVVISTILARNLGANDYGVVGVAMIVIGFLGRFDDMGMTAALVQRRTVDERVLETAQALNLILAGILFLSAQIAAPFTATVFKSQAVPLVVRVLALSFLISVVGFLPTALLTRDMQFAKLRAPSVVGTLVRGIVAVSLALTGGKYWSLVAGTLAGGFTTAVLLRVFRHVKAHRHIHRDIARELLRYGLPLWGSGVLTFIVFNVDNLVIGSFMGTSALGFYTVAITWSTFACSALYETVHSVLFPRFSQIQLDQVRLAQTYFRSLQAVIFVAVMANATLFAVADGFLFTVLGKGSPRWLPSLHPLQILCVYGALRASMEPVGPVLMALGRSKLLLWANLIPASLELCLLPFAVLKWGLPGAASVVCGAYSLQWIVYGPFLKRHLKIGPSSLLKAAVPAVVAAILGILASDAIPFDNPLSWQSIVLRSAAVCIVYLVVHEALTRGAMLTEANLVVQRFKRRTTTHARTE